MKNALAMAVGRTHYRYSQYFNQLHGRTGHLWQNRFDSCPIGSEHFWRTLAYVEQNPVRSGVVPVAWEYRWSSAAAHVGREDPGGLVDAGR